MKSFIGFTILFSLSVANATQKPAVAMACASNRYFTVADFEKGVFRLAAALV